MHRAVLIRLLLSAVVVTVGCGSSVNVDPIQATTTLDPRAADMLYTDLLGAHVRDGLVDYATLCQDDRLTTYIGFLAATDPDTFEIRDAKLAFWLNAYNAYTLKIICDNYPIGSIGDLHSGGLILGTLMKKTIWHKKFVIIGGESTSLDHIEHQVIRSVFADPRAHFALVCAARSCPPLRAEAYVAERLEDQLEEQGRVFMRTPDKNRFDVQTKTVHLSKIFDWFQRDFARGDEELLLYVARYAPREIARQIEEDPEAWTLEHTKYDWSLNASR